MSEPLAGTLIAARYEIVRGIGHGSFGRTFLARDTSAQRDVAIKMLDRRSSADLKAVELFEREALVLRSMRHQGVPEVHDLVRDSWDGLPATFLVMEFVDGVELSEIIDERRALDPAHVLHLFLELLGILEYLHGRVPPVVHRDIKPANIIVRPDGQPALVDFGSVRRVFMGAEESGSTIVGTYGYMPYEQYMGQATPASDLYSLAATFLHLLTGRAPREFIKGEGRIEVPGDLPGDARMAPILTKLLSPSPADRFARAADVRSALLAPVSSVALVPTASNAFSVVQPTRELIQLPPVPRPIEGDTKELLKNLTPGALELMDPSVKPADSGGLLDWIWLGFFTVATAGILPLAFISMSRNRRRRLRRFLRDGFPANAEIISITDEKLPFDSKIAKVSYRFLADGAPRRDADQILHIIANRWLPGDTIQILYLPDMDYDSVIIST